MCDDFMMKNVFFLLQEKLGGKSIHDDRRPSSLWIKNHILIRKINVCLRFVTFSSISGVNLSKIPFKSVSSWIKISYRPYIDKFT